jgi:hypothetical protein
VHHSRPGATSTILLIFNGINVTNTGWNIAPPITPVFVAAAFNREVAGPVNFTVVESEAITDVWMQVSEAYRAFDVDVTTVAPASCGSGCGKGGGCGDCDNRVQINVIPGSKDNIGTTGKLPRPDAGGVAYVYIFRNGRLFRSPEYRPTWNYNGGVDNVQSLATTIVHEAGHNFGLNHHAINQTGAGVVGNDQYLQSLTGIDGTTWGPVMGANFGVDVSQFSNGDYAGAILGQDDLAFLAINTAGYVPAPAPAVLGGGAAGIITSDTPVAYTLDTPAATSLKITAVTQHSSPGQDGVVLFMRLTVSIDGGTVCNISGSPTVTCNLANVPLGTHTVTIAGVGSPTLFNGAPLFSSYGSIGSYNITTNTVLAPTVAPVAVPTVAPVAVPTTNPTTAPVAVPTATPTTVPTTAPVAVPTATPTNVPTTAPVAVPTTNPTTAPVAVPTVAPVAVPTATPTTVPTTAPVAVPTVAPVAPVAVPTATPTTVPTTTFPTSPPPPPPVFQAVGPVFPAGERDTTATPVTSSATRPELGCVVVVLGLVGLCVVFGVVDS